MSGESYITASKLIHTTRTLIYSIKRISNPSDEGVVKYFDKNYQPELIPGFPFWKKVEHLVCVHFQTLNLSMFEEKFKNRDTIEITKRMAIDQVNAFFNPI